MSTYTDLHNKLKETIVVDYKTRETNQAVKMLNSLNEFWGTFRGKVVAEETLLSGTTLSGVTIVDSTLSG